MDLKALLDTPPWEWPEEAGPTLQQVLASKDASAEDRLLAAELAGESVVIDDDLAGVLLAIVRNPEEAAGLRAQAAIALGPALEDADTNGFDEPDDVPISERTFGAINDTLRTVYQDAGVPTDTRRSVLEAAVRAPQDWQQGAVRAAFASGDESWKLTAVFCMRFVRGFDASILEALGSPNPEIRYQAMSAAGAWGVQGAFEHVATVLRSKRADKQLLLAAIEAIATVRPDAADELLAPCLESKDEDIVAAAEEALTMAEHGDAAFDEEDEDE
jgi:hypothetical protein